MKNILYFFNSKSPNKFLIFIILMIQYQFLLPFSLSNNVLFRLFTVDKIMVLLILVTCFLWGVKVLINIKYIVFFLLIFGVFTSNFLNGILSYNGILLFKEVIFILYIISLIIILSNYENLVTYIRWSFYIVCFLVIFSIIDIFNVNQHFMKIFSGTNIVHAIQSQSLTVGGDYNITSKFSFLWFDGNNFAYIIIPQILLIISIFYTCDAEIKSNTILILLLLILSFTLLRTLSRGALASLLVGIIALLFFRVGVKKKIKTIIRAILIITFTFSILYITSGKYFTVISDKYLKLFGLFSVSRTYSRDPGGLENSRLVTTQIAISEFLDKPVFGWGSEKVSGVYNKFTGNHSGYLILLVKYGLFGFIISIIIFIIAIKKFLRSRKKIILVNNQVSYYILWNYILSLTILRLLTGLFHSISLIYFSVLLIAFVSVLNAETKKIS